MPQVPEDGRGAPLDVVAKVQEDLDDRRELGIRRYGHLIDLYDGRNWLQEAYEEALDLCVYLRAQMEMMDRARTKEP